MVNFEHPFDLPFNYQRHDVIRSKAFASERVTAPAPVLPAKLELTTVAVPPLKRPPPEVAVLPLKVESRTFTVPTLNRPPPSASPPHRRRQPL